MATTIQKWGNSLGIRIPKAVAEQADFQEGLEVEVSATAGGLTIHPKRKTRRRAKLSELLAQMTPRHRHGELNKGGPRGRETI